MMTLVGYIANRSAVMLIECGVKENKLDYEELTEHVLGEYGYHAALISMFFFAYGAQIAYLLVIGDAVPLGSSLNLFIQSLFRNLLTLSYLVLQDIYGDSIYCDRNFIMLISGTFIVLPLCLTKHYGTLSWTSLFSIILDFTIVIIVIIVAPTAGSNQGIHHTAPLTIINDNLFAGIGTMSFAFICQHNSFIVYRSLKERTSSNWRIVANYSVGFAYFLCLLFSIVGYLSFLEYTEGDLLNNFTKSNKAVNVARILLAITMLFTYPMECFVTRHCISSIFNKLWLNYQHRTQLLTTTESSSDDYEKTIELSGPTASSTNRNWNKNYVSVKADANMSPLHTLSDSSSSDSNIQDVYEDNLSFILNRYCFRYPPVTYDDISRIALTLLLWGSSLALAISFNDFGIVLALTGCIAASMLGYVLPAVIFIRCHITEFNTLLVKLRNYQLDAELLSKFFLPLFMIFFGFLSLIAGLATVGSE
jgi:amino acid permease